MEEIVTGKQDYDEGILKYNDVGSVTCHPPCGEKHRR
jgi:hypothetical protein